jgi:hypothetical protein
MKELYTLLSSFFDILPCSDQDSADTTFDSACGVSPGLSEIG